jgi:hypothetical protein
MALLPLPALAQVPAGQQPGGPRQPNALMTVEPVGMMIAAFDSDGDGRVTRAEFDAGVRHSFDTIAAGRDAIGYLAFSDWAERWLGHRAALPSPFEVDVNGDNRITLDELQDRFALFFTRFDADKDGAITRAELVTVRNLEMPRPPAEGRRRR